MSDYDVIIDEVSKTVGNVLPDTPNKNITS